MMTKVDASKPVQGNLFKVMLRDIVSVKHELVLLRNAIDWDRFEKVALRGFVKKNIGVLSQSKSPGLIAI